MRRMRARRPIVRRDDRILLTRPESSYGWSFLTRPGAASDGIA